MTAFFGRLSFSLFSLLLLADEGGDELDYFVLLAARERGDFLEYLLDFAGGTGLRFFRFAADARSISTAYTYDALNRVTFRNYSDSTPDVTYTYDYKTNAYGKLTKVSSSVSTTEYTAFDILGRVTSHKQKTDGNDYVTGYTYNLSGALIKETYPSGRKMKNTFDADGALSLVEAFYGVKGYRTVAGNFTYNAAGAVTSMKLGNGRWESTTFNNRLQPTQIALGTTQNATDLLKLNYSYGTTANNGNVLSQTVATGEYEVS